MSSWVLAGLSEGLARLADTVAPRRCTGCDEPSAHVLCEVCVELALALPVPPPRPAAYGACRAALPLAAPARGAIHAAKYRGCRRAIHVLAALAAERLTPELLAAGPPEAVVPVPLGVRRRRLRGFNQAEVAAAALCAACRLPPPRTGLRRVRETPAQVGLGEGQRLRNLSAAFRWEDGRLGGGTVWLVDDVVTTGATFAAAAYALQQAGAGRIEAVAMASCARRGG
ncbi:MAG: ComF family protein [Chloroflexi bacterium]|nr:MAG: ComF family protein [Chloroflexota bacterium]